MSVNEKMDMSTLVCMRMLEYCIALTLTDLWPLHSCETSQNHDIGHTLQTVEERRDYGIHTKF